MANLFETIQKNYGQVLAPKQQVNDETLRAQKLLQARGGKQVAVDSEGVISNNAELAAVDESNAQLEALQPAATVQQQAVGVQQQQASEQFRQKQAEIRQANNFDNLQTRMKTNQVLGDLSRDRGTLDAQRDAARLEQAGFLLAMQNKKYVADLQDYARRERLQESTRFAEEMDRTIFGSSLDLLKQKLGTDSVVAANDRDFKKAMSRFTIEDAVRVADAEMAHDRAISGIRLDAIRAGAKYDADAANTAAKYKGMGEILKGGISAVGQYKGSSDSAPGQDASEVNPRKTWNIT